MSVEQPVPSVDSGDSPAPVQRIEVPSDQLASGWITGVTFALAGACLAWGLLLTLPPVFSVPPTEFGPFEQPTAEQAARLREGAARASLGNAVLALAWTGALLAGFMAVGEGVARRSARAALLGLAGCALIGALFGSLAGWAGHSVSQLIRTSPQLVSNLPRIVVVQMTIWAVLGGGVGLALGCLTGCARNGFVLLLGGVLAGAFAGMIYPITAAYLMPTFQTEQMIPQAGAGALLWLGTAAFFLGVVLPEMKTRRIRQTSGRRCRQREQLPRRGDQAAALAVLYFVGGGVPLRDLNHSLIACR